jgi:hypothetical protein
LAVSQDGCLEAHRWLWEMLPSRSTAREPTHHCFELGPGK